MMKFHEFIEQPSYMYLYSFMTWRHLRSVEMTFDVAQPTVQTVCHTLIDDVHVSACVTTEFWRVKMSIAYNTAFLTTIFDILALHQFFEHHHVIFVFSAYTQQS